MLGENLYFYASNPHFYPSYFERTWMVHHNIVVIFIRVSKNHQKGYTFLTQTHQFAKGKSSKIMKIWHFFSKWLFGKKTLNFFDGIFLKVHLLIEEKHFDAVSKRFQQFKLPKNRNSSLCQKFVPPVLTLIKITTTSCFGINSTNFSVNWEM